MLTLLIKVAGPLYGYTDHFYFKINDAYDRANFDFIELVYPKNTLLKRLHSMLSTRHSAENVIWAE